jgi:hypothetical protein
MLIKVEMIGLIIRSENRSQQLEFPVARFAN